MKMLIALAAGLLATGASAQMQPSSGGMQPAPQQQQQQPMNHDMPRDGSRAMNHDMHSDRMEHREMRREHRMMRHDEGRHMGWHKRKVCNWGWRHHHRVKMCRWVRR